MEDVGNIRTTSLREIFAQLNYFAWSAFIQTIAFYTKLSSLFSKIGSSGENYLAIFGGLGENHKPLCDLILLNLDTLAWTDPIVRVEQNLACYGPPLPGCK